MPHRMDVELTSARDDGTWTWRAAGAKQPKGVIDAGLLHEGARVGDVVRVEATFEVDGISVTSVLPPKEKGRAEPTRLEVIGPPPPPPPPARSAGPKGQAPRGRGGKSEGADGRHGPGRAARAKPAGSKPAGSKPDARPARAGAEQRGPRSRNQEQAPPKPKRLHPGNAHRATALAALPPEQRPVAEQVLRGGIPAVRHAVEAQNAELRRQGQPEISPEPLVTLAEELLPALKRAEWRDRAEAAAKAPDDVPLRDLRSVVAGADAAARDDESRLLASTLRQALEERLRHQRQRWLADITAALDEGRLVRALRLSARPPDPGSRFPADLALRLSEVAGAAMAPDASPDRWLALLEAVAEAPVRRSVKPAGLPESAGEELLHSARQACGRVPALAPLLGIDMPPPPGPPRPGGGRPRRGPLRRPSPPPIPDGNHRPAPTQTAPSSE